MSNTGAAMAGGSPSKTILSLDGGGIRGYSSLMILEKLMGEIQTSLGLPSPPLPCECFDIIGGTSTGGIIAILLGRLRMSVSEALNAYNRVAELAFTPKVYIPFRPPTMSKYSDAKLVEAIRKELESAEASNGDKDALFADTQAPKTVVLAITEINVNAGPTLFRTYQAEPAWKDCKIWEVARATSAATTFFDSIKIGRDAISFIDAGFGYNNPCKILLDEAKKAIPHRPTSCIVSIGTGLEGAVRVNTRFHTLLKALADMATSSRAVHTQLQRDFDSKEPQKYWRFDEDVALKEIKMDSWKKLRSIAGHTHNYLNSPTTDTTIKKCAESLIAAKPNLRKDAVADSLNPLLEPIPLSEEEDSARFDFLKLISFAEMEFREQTVDAAYKATYKWMLNSSSYSAWKQSPGRRLLVKGKAGCGKSTLMKHLFKNEIATVPSAAANAAASFDKRKPVVCGFFFNGRGGPMEKTLEGMLRTILHQIVFQNPIAFRCLSQFYQDVIKASDSRMRNVDWTGESLMKMFETVMRSSTLPTLIFIDALDEGEGFSPAEVFALLEEYTSSKPDRHHSTASVCLSSRPGNFVNHRKKWTTIDLGNSNSADIEAYTTSRLNTMAKDCADSGYEHLAAELVPEILRRADGVFLWVKLVVDEITAAMERYESMEYIRSQLSATPTDLWDRFGTILKKVKEHHESNKNRLLQAVLAAERPLSVEELVHVMSLTSPCPPCNLHDVWDVEKAEKARGDMKRCILLYCGGLVGVVEKSRSFRLRRFPIVEYKLTTQVQFIHQSVKDYLNSRQIPKEPADMPRSLGLEDNGHQLLLTACTRYLQLPETAAVADHEAPNPWSVELDQLNAFWKETLDQHPFLLYSPFWVRHADKSVEADPESVDREQLQSMEKILYVWRSFPYSRSRKWGLYAQIYRNLETSSEASSSLLSFSAYQGFAQLIKKVPHAPAKGIPQLVLDRALVAACDSGLRGVYTPLGLHAGTRQRRNIDSEERGFGLPETVWKAKEAIVRLLLDGGANVNRKTRVGRFGSALTAACWSGRLSIVRELLNREANVNAEIPDWNYGTALIASVWGSSTEIAKTLIDQGAEVNAQIKAGNVGSALAEAAISGDTNMVQMLIDNRADVNLALQYGKLGSALAAAAFNGKLTTATLLVERGAKVNMKVPGIYGSALAAAGNASWSCGLEIMEMLVRMGAEVDLILDSGDYGSALAAAASVPELDFVKRLVSLGADVNAILNVGIYGSALAAAASCGDYDFSVAKPVVLFLLEHGADVNAVLPVGTQGSALGAARGSRGRPGSYRMENLLVEHGAKLTGNEESESETLSSNDE